MHFGSRQENSRHQYVLCLHQTLIIRIRLKIIPKAISHQSFVLQISEDALLTLRLISDNNGMIPPLKTRLKVYTFCRGYTPARKDARYIRATQFSRSGVQDVATSWQLRGRRGDYGVYVALTGKWGENFTQFKICHLDPVMVTYTT